ncbi:MAG: hypothetical protein IJY20_06665, partial [Clostridia bacterium]|nr:hypothetical protein [Clostridia bacterium]
MNAALSIPVAVPLAARGGKQKETHNVRLKKRNVFLAKNGGNLPRANQYAPGILVAALPPPFRFPYGVTILKQKETHIVRLFLFGDPYGNRTHVFAVRGRCL